MKQLRITLNEITIINTTNDTERANIINVLQGIRVLKVLKVLKVLNVVNLLENLSTCYKNSRKDSIYAKYLYDDWRCVKDLWHIKTNNLIL